MTHSPLSFVSCAIFYILILISSQKYPTYLCSMLSCDHKNWSSKPHVYNHITKMKLCIRAWPLVTSLTGNSWNLSLYGSTIQGFLSWYLVISYQTSIPLPTNVWTSILLLVFFPSVLIDNFNTKPFDGLCKLGFGYFLNENYREYVRYIISELIEIYTIPFYLIRSVFLSF